MCFGITEGLFILIFSIILSNKLHNSSMKSFPQVNVCIGYTLYYTMLSVYMVRYVIDHFCSFITLSQDLWLTFP